MEESSVRKSRMIPPNLQAKLKGPEILVREFEEIVNRRKEHEDEKRVLDMKRHLVEEKKKISVKKEL